jgi:hypothetical protein
MEQRKWRFRWASDCMIRWTRVMQLLRPIPDIFAPGSVTRDHVPTPQASTARVFLTNPGQLENFLH